MATFNSLVDAQCGNAAPLVQLTRLYTNDKTNVLQDGLIRPFSNDFINADRDQAVNQLVQEYHQPLAAPTTFHLNGLLSNLQLSSNDADNEEERRWSSEFLDSTVARSSLLLSDSQSLGMRPYNQSTMSAPPPFAQYPMMPYPMTVNFSHSSPMNFAITQEEQLLRAFLQDESSENLNRAESSMKEASSIVNENNTNAFISDLFWNTPMSTKNSNIYSEYQFIPNNPFLNYSNPFEEGVKRLAVHDIVNAVLYFEAAVQREPDHVDGWLYLGMTQSENEQDPRAIFALNKCLELDPNNLTAYMIIASSYANESLTNDAMEALRQWLSHKPEYAHLLPKMKKLDESQFPDLYQYEDLQKTFLLAISASSNRIDPDLQVCLGILYHLLCDYDKAAECFQTAALTKPDDARLWNKLGASLANGGASEKAVDAYCRALTLSPGFVRARYNLGISCFNLRAYRQAVEHFLIALKQQNEGLGPLGAHGQMSENIWRTLGTALSHLERPDLEISIINRDLEKLLKEFEMN